MKQWVKELFGVEKPVIAMCHFQAMPGDRDYDAERALTGYWNPPALICTHCKMAAWMRLCFPMSAACPG